MNLLIKVAEDKRYKYFSLYTMESEEIEEFKPTHFDKFGDVVPDSGWKGVFIKTPEKSGEQRPRWSFRGLKNDGCMGLVEKLKKEFEGEKIYYLMGYPFEVRYMIPW